MTAVALLAAVLLAACSEPTAQGASGPPRAPSAETPALAATAPATGSGAESPPTADAVRAATKECKQVSSGLYKLDAKGEDKVPVCGREGAVFWTADLDVDCDGRESTRCNKKADPDYQSETAAHDSHGDSLDAAAVPYVVVPGVSDRWSYKAAGLRVGRSVVAVVHGDRVAYGVIGDVGPKALLGEASYAMASRLGMDPDPRRGGADGGVLYVAFTGADGEVQKPEDTAEVERAGKRLAARLVRGK
jgi:hypothetical protein